MSQFKVLWIDDQTQKCRRDAKSVEDIIESMGFEADVVFEDDISDASLRSPEGKINRAIKSRSVDLFIIDFNLKNDIFGSDIIREIRSNNDIYTDIIFYSSDSKELINAIKATFDEASTMDFFDGVYVVPLGDEFIPKIQYVIGKIVKSWYNVHSIRGVLLSKASKFELLVATIIRESYTPCLDYIKERLSGKGENVVRTTRRKWENVEKTYDPVELILGDPINFNWAVKKLMLEELIDKGIITLPSWGDLEEIFILRNDFAHNPIHLKDGVLVLSKNGEYINYTENDIERIREKLSMVEKELLELASAKKTDGENAMEEDKRELALV